MIKAADLFCGAGGTSIGAKQTGEVDVAFALNHWDRAIETHEANFPETKHAQSALKWTHPSECPKINLLFASPECTHHSRARGGRPTSNQQRSGAWEIMPWIEHHRPSMIVVENVVEFKEWGPVGDNGTPLKSMKGRFFEAWVSAIQSAGYRVEFQRLNAADFGAATSRTRLFVVAKKGRRTFNWPDPTHLKNPGSQLPGFETERWRGAIEVIDWSIPLPSLFGRKRPLADKTLARIQKGLERHVEPFVVKLRTHGSDYSLKDPIGTVTAGGLHHSLAVPFTTIHRGQSVSRGSDQPISTITSGGGHHGLAVPMIVKFDNQSSMSTPKSVQDPTSTLATKCGQALAVPLIMSPQSGGTAKPAANPVPTITTMAGSQLVVPFLSSFYGSQNTSQGNHPVPTITTVDRHALTGAALNGHSHAEPQTDAERSLAAVMARLGVADIGFRMLANHELSAAQGFPIDYKFCGNKKEVTKQIGNSVSPPVARSITEALLG